MLALKERKKEAKAIVIALNSTGPCFDNDPYPIGNKELRAKAIGLSQESLITFNRFTGLWKVGPR